MKILNLGCGCSPLKDSRGNEYTNVDMLDIPGVVKHDLMKPPYPFQSASFDKVYMFHCIEHIPRYEQFKVTQEIHRLLKPESRVYFSYPEFIKCATNYINNLNGERDFWEATIYGRGETEWDRHKTLMNTAEFKERLKVVGLVPIKEYPEKDQSFNTVLICKKGVPLSSYEDLMGAEWR